MKKILLHRFLIAIILASFVGCTTPYTYQTNGFEDAVVIEATLTNQLKTQQIKISRTYSLEEKFPQVETGAVVYVSDNLGNKYDFNFLQNLGAYLSVNQFQILPDRDYELHVLTKNGRTYVSSKEKLPTQTQIESVIPTPITKDGILGVQIAVNSADPNNTSRYYRYEYDETYKIVAPRWYPDEAVRAPSGNTVIYKLRTTEARICFSNQTSNEILLTNTNDLSEDRVTNFPVKFISAKDPIITHRYSMLVKQYVQSLAAHTYFQTLKEISNNGSILSQTQPGFIPGNIKSVDNPGEKVIGYFDVSSYSEKRMFFNFSDLFPRVPMPIYPYYCPPEIAPAEADLFLYNNCYSTTPGSTCKGPTIVALIENRQKVYYPTEGVNPIILYDIPCGDCTSISSNIKPSFWID